MPIPKGPSGNGMGMMGNWMLVHPEASKNQQPAADFIKWMLQADTQKIYAAEQRHPDPHQRPEGPELTAANPYFPVLAQALQAPPNWRPRTDQWNAVETIIGTHLNAPSQGRRRRDRWRTKASERDPHASWPGPATRPATQ